MVVATEVAEFVSASKVLGVCAPFGLQRAKARIEQVL